MDADVLHKMQPWRNCGRGNFDATHPRPQFLHGRIKMQHIRVHNSSMVNFDATHPRPQFLHGKFSGQKKRRHLVTYLAPSYLPGT